MSDNRTPFTALLVEACALLPASPESVETLVKKAVALMDSLLAGKASLFQREVIHGRRLANLLMDRARTDFAYLQLTDVLTPQQAHDLAARLWEENYEGKRLAQILPPLPLPWPGNPVASLPTV